VPGVQGLKHITSSNSLKVKGIFSSLQNGSLNYSLIHCQSSIFWAKIRKQSLELLNFYRYLEVGSKDTGSNCFSSPIPSSEQLVHV
jgi:hypothetical protein